MSCSTLFGSAAATYTGGGGTRPGTIETFNTAEGLNTYLKQYVDLYLGAGYDCGMTREIIGYTADEMVAFTRMGDAPVIDPPRTGTQLVLGASVYFLRFESSDSSWIYEVGYTYSQNNVNGGSIESEPYSLGAWEIPTGPFSVNAFKRDIIGNGIVTSSIRYPSFTLEFMEPVLTEAWFCCVAPQCCANPEPPAPTSRPIFLYPGDERDPVNEKAVFPPNNETMNYYNFCFSLPRFTRK